MDRIIFCIACLGLACLGLTACGEGEVGFGGPGGGAVSDLPPGVDPQGQALYAQLCASCHGSGGGDVRGATNITRVVRDGTRGMPAFPNLSAGEIGSIEAYLNGRDSSAGAADAPAGGGAPSGGTPPPSGDVERDDDEEEDDD